MLWASRIKGVRWAHSELLVLSRSHQSQRREGGGKEEEGWLSDLVK